MKIVKKDKTDEQREDKRCGGCDCYESENGCECNLVPCSNCGNCDKLYNMHHDEFHSAYWFNGMSYDEKLSEIVCIECIHGREEEKEEYEEYEE
tara:strand:- start:188 stop:469 length:282 start_codon:yes stop_codon:yes gene_type:complete